MKFEIKNRWTGKVHLTAEIECAIDSPVGLKIGLAVVWAVKTGADLRDADLRNANLRDADLRNADLRGANLRDADLRNADLRDADLSDADLRGANLSDADLRDADLGDADLRGADLSDADLRNANLSDADLRGANLSDADLRDADLSDADLRGADLSDADLRNANLRDADLSDLEIPLIKNIDAKILAAIENNKAAGTNGLDMGVWHGEKCDENNWCETTHCRAGYAVCVAGKAGFDLERALGGDTAVAAILLYRKSMPDEPPPNFYCSNEDAMDDMKARAGKYAAAEDTAL